jgi:membrane protease YdiL (CAAX protease family)
MDSKKKITVFFIIFLLLNVPIYYLMLTLPSSMRIPLIICIMWSPGISAIITKLICDHNLRNLGWGWGKWRYQLLSYFLPAILSLIVYSVVWSTGIGELSIGQFVKIRNKGSLSFDGGAAFIQVLLISMSLGFLKSFTTAFGEEIGWRGFLVKEFSNVTSYTNASWIIGIVWAVWHIPGILFVGYNAGTSPYFAVPCFTVMIVSATFIMNWIRLCSGSLWTGAIFHASHNLFIQSVYDLMTVDKGITRYFTTEFGIGMAFIYVIAAYFFWRRRSALSAGNLETKAVES